MKKRMRDIVEDISSGQEDNVKSSRKMMDWEGVNVEELYSSWRYLWWLQIIRDQV